MPPKTKNLFQWQENLNRETPLTATTVKNYKASLNTLASKEYIDDDGTIFYIDTIDKLLKHPEEIIKEIESFPTNNPKVQTYAAIMYELGIGKTKNGSFAKLTRQTLKYYNAYQKTKLDKDGNPHSSQKGFDSFEEYLHSFQSSL
jgi:hypothetical protein